MFLYLNEQKNTLHMVSLKRIENTNLRELCVEDTFIYQKKILVEEKEVFVDMTAKEILEKIDYKSFRYSEYPTIKEQLDMLYHDKKEGTNTWLENLEAVKNKYPKPNGG